MNPYTGTLRMIGFETDFTAVNGVWTLDKPLPAGVVIGARFRVAGTEWEVTNITLDRRRIQAKRALARQISGMVMHHAYSVPAPPPLLVGVGGYKTSGKDAFASVLERKQGFTRLGMSDPLLAWTHAENPWVAIHDPGAGSVGHPFYEVIEAGVPHDFSPSRSIMFVRAVDLLAVVSYEEAKKIPDYRDYLMKIGTEAGRQIIGENVWVDVAKRSIGSERRRGKPVVITGIRYENELRMIRDLGGVSVWVDRPVVTAFHEASQAAAEKHSSEVSLTAADFDHVVVNGEGLRELAREAVLFGALATRSETGALPPYAAVYGLPGEDEEPRWLALRDEQQGSGFLTFASTGGGSPFVFTEQDRPVEPEVLQFEFSGAFEVNDSLDVAGVYRQAPTDG